MNSIEHDDDPSYNTKGHSDSIHLEYSRSIQGNFFPSQFLKLYLMYSANDATSTIVDFVKGYAEDGVVDRPLSRGTSRMPMCSPSPLFDCQLTPIQEHSCSPIQCNGGTPQKPLYCKASLYSTQNAKGKAHIQYSNGFIFLKPPIS